MSGLTAATRDGSGTATIDAEALEAFVTGHRGPCLTAADDGYDDARIIWNGSADKRPADRRNWVVRPAVIPSTI